MEKTMFSVRGPEESDMGRYVLVLLNRIGSTPFATSMTMSAYVIDTFERNEQSMVGRDATGQLVVECSNDYSYMIIPRELFRQYSRLDEMRRQHEDQLELEALSKELGLESPAGESEQATAGGPRALTPGQYL